MTKNIFVGIDAYLSHFCHQIRQILVILKSNLVITGKLATNFDVKKISRGVNILFAKDFLLDCGAEFRYISIAATLH